MRRKIVYNRQDLDVGCVRKHGFKVSVTVENTLCFGPKLKKKNFFIKKKKEEKDKEELDCHRE